MSENWTRALEASEIADGGMKAVKLEGRDIVICNCGGEYFAVERCCGHANAPLEKGTLDGRILTCPVHYAQFDVTTGKPLSQAVPPYPPKEGASVPDLTTKSLNTYKVKIEQGWVLIAL